MHVALLNGGKRQINAYFATNGGGKHGRKSIYGYCRKRRASR